MTRLSKLLVVLLWLSALPAQACDVPLHDAATPLAKGEVALTFDDGPAPVTTPAVLQTLRDNCARATFFMIGKRVDDNPALARAVLADGHTIGSHSWSHARMDKLSAPEQLNDFNHALASLQTALGQPVHLYRFPELATTPALLEGAGQRQMTVVDADISSDDWKGLSPEDIVTTTLQKLQVKGGGIIIMHDARENMAQALPALLAALIDDGYRIVQLR